MNRLFCTSLVLSLCYCSACSLLWTDGEPDAHYFTARVDSVSVPSTVRATDTLTVSLHGWIGSNGCFSFERFEAERSPAQLKLSVIGSVVDAQACPAVMVPIPSEYKVAPPLEGPFSIVVRQPDGSTLERTVEVVR